MKYKITLEETLKKGKGPNDVFGCEVRLTFRPNLVDNDLISRIKPLVGRRCSQSSTGARVQDINKSVIIIEHCCDSCRDDLLGQIYSLLGKKVRTEITVLAS